MLDEFEQSIAQLATFDIEKEIMYIIDSNSELISNLLAEQLAQGIDGNNQEVTIFGNPNYSPRTVRQKKQFGSGLGSVTDRITNYDSGAFYTGLYVKSEIDAFDIVSNVPYFDEIIARSGGIIMELNEEHLLYLRDSVILPELQKVMEAHFS